MTLSSTFASLAHISTKGLLLKFLSSNKPKPLFASYEEAAQRIGSYEHKDIIEVVKQKTRQMRQNPSLIISERITLQNLFVTNFVFSQTKKPLRVLDFGGALGGNFYLVDHFLPSTISQWHVIETPAMAAVGNQESKLKHLHFEHFNKLNSLIKQQFDLLFIQGVLHYTPEPLSNLEKLLQLNSRYVYISRQPLVTSSNKSFITQQTSPLLAHGPGVLTDSKPQWQNQLTHFPITLNPQKKFEKLFIQYGYQPHFIFEEEPSYAEHFTNTSINCIVRGHLLERK